MSYSLHELALKQKASNSHQRVAAVQYCFGSCFIFIFVVSLSLLIFWAYNRSQHQKKIVHDIYSEVKPSSKRVLHDPSTVTCISAHTGMNNSQVGI